MTVYQRDCLERVAQLLDEARTLSARTTLDYAFFSDLDHLLATARANLGETSEVQ